MADIGDMIIRGKMDNSQALHALSQLQREMIAVEKTTNTRLSSIAGAVSKGVAAAATAAAAGMSTLMVGVSRTAGSLDDMVNKASKLQIAVGDFQALGYAAKIANVDMSALEMSMKKLSLSVASAAGGGSKNTIFKQLGLDAKELMALSPDKQFLAVANALKQVSNVTDRAAMGTGLLGKQWVETSNLINSNLEQSLQKFDKFGLKLTEQQAALIDSYGDSKDDLATIYDGIWQKLTVKVVPAMQKVVDKTTEWLLSGDNIEKLTDTIANGMVAAIEGATSAFSAMATLIGGIASTMRDMVSLAKELGSSLGERFDKYHANTGAGKLVNKAVGLYNIASTVTSSLPQLGQAPGQLATINPIESPVINVAKALEKFKTSTEEATASLESLLGLGAMSGQSYLSNILTEIPQAMDPTFTRLANEIRDSKLTGQGFGGSVESKLALMKSIAMQSGGESYDYTSGKMNYTSNAGMMAAVKALEDANKKEKEPVQVNISIDKDGNLITTLQENVGFMKWNDNRIDKRAEEAARGARN